MFNQSGLERRTPMELLPLVHYIWWGNPTTDRLALDASKTPNELAKLGRVSVHCWRNSADTMIGSQPARGREYALQRAGAWPSRAALHENIIVHEVKRRGVTAAEILTGALCPNGSARPVHETHQDRGQLIDGIIATMSAYNMRSAVKDLLCLLVLYRYGGWYFDTTTAITEPRRADIVAKLRPVIEPYSEEIAVENEVRFVKTRISRKVTLKLDDRSDDYTMMLGNLSTELPGVVELDDVDTWAMYAPPSHPAILTMIDSYIERARNMGLDRYGLCDTGPSPKTAQQQRNHHYLLQDSFMKEAEQVSKLSSLYHFSGAN